MAHLGNGASLCGAIGGESRTSSMGFSALDGLMMGTRSGTLDPGVLLWLMEQGWTRERIERLLYRESGLLGVSGLSADMRRLREAAAGGHERAQLAIDLFTHRIVRGCGAVAAVLQGLDVIAFSGGIGEHDAPLRSDVAQRLQWLGVRIDEAANRAATGDVGRAIHAAGSAVELWVVPTDEGVVAAQQAARCLSACA
jgi:acetate kinase